MNKFFLQEQIEKAQKLYDKLGAEKRDLFTQKMKLKSEINRLENMEHKLLVETRKKEVELGKAFGKLEALKEVLSIC